MQIKIVTTANTAQAEAQFAALTGQVEALNRAMARTSVIPAGGSIQGFQQQQRALRGANAAYNAALASSGAFRVEQLRLNDVLDRQVQLMQKQKLSFRQVWGKDNRKLMKQVYREQLAMQQMVAQTTGGGVGDGRMRMNLAVPGAVHKSWDTLSNKVAFFSQQLASASGHLQNWGKNTQWAGRQMTAGISMPIAAFGAAAGVMAYQVDKQMTRIQKVYNTTASINSQSVEEQKAAEKELMQVREDAMKTAINAARQYGQSVTDTLNVQAELAATGMKGATLQSATTEVMKNAMLGEIDYQTTTKATIALQQQMHLSSKELADTWAYMNSVENETSLSMEDFATAIPIALGPLRQMKGDVQDLGTLLTGMVAQGVQVGKAANAIKALPQRLLRPGKQVQEEWKEITGTDILDIAKRNQGSAMGMLEEIYEVTKDLTSLQKGKAFAGLFGSYQLTTMSAMVDSMGKLADGYGQVSQAQEVGTRTTKEWIDVQNQEIQAVQESASGKFKRAWETLRGEMADIGQPFLEVATKFLEGFTKIASAFNNLPDWGKKAAIVTAIVAAMVGPVVMLVGLFANFAGTLGKFLAPMLLRVSGGMGLLTKEQTAAKVATALANREFATQAGRAQILTEQITALTNATRAYGAAMTQSAGLNPLAAAGNRNLLPIVPGVGNAPAPTGNAVPIALQGSAAWAKEQQGGRTHFAMNPDTKRMEGESRKAYKERLAMAEKTAVVERGRLQTQQAVNMQAAAEQKIREQTQASMNGMAVSSAVMAGSMGLMMVNSNKTVDNIAQMAMLAAIMIPAFKGLGSGIKTMAGNIGTAAKGQWASAAGAAKGAKETTKLAGATRAAKASAAGLAAGFSSMMGPVGWITLAVGAAVVGLIALNKHQKKIYEEQLAQQRSLITSAGRWAESMGKVEGHYRRIQSIGGEMASSTQFEKDVASYSKIDGKKGEQYDTAQAFGDLGSMERAARATKMFIDLQVKSGMTAVQAGDKMRALYVAIGYSMTEASQEVDKLVSGVGDLKNMDWGEALANQSKIFKESLFTNNPDAVKASGREFAEVFSQGFATADLGEETDTLMDTVETTALAKWQDMFDAFSKDRRGKELFKKLGIDSAKEFSIAFRRGDFDGELISALGTEQAKNFQAGAEAANETEKAVIRGIASYMHLGKEITTVTELMNDMTIKAKTMTFSESVDEAQKLFNGLTATNSEVVKASINQINFVRGIKQGETASQALFNLMNNIKDESRGASVEAEKIGNKLKGLPKYINIALQLNAKQMLDVRKAGMEGVTNDLADAASSAFDSRMQASLDGTQAAWDKKISAQQAAGERASERLDAKWERINERFEKRWERRKDAVNDYYDKRIKGIDKAIKAEEKAEATRQRIFEAERTRMQRMSEMANQTIDFNMQLRTGNLDEAAKIKNNMEATTQDWLLSDASEKSATGSQARIDRLDNSRERYDDAREKALDALEKREADEKRSLEKREAREKRSLERRTQANADALQKQAQAAQAAAQARWNMERDSFNQRLTLFKSYIARDQKDLERWMKKVGLSYDDFGIKTKRKGENWSTYFENSMVQHMREAGARMASDNMWAGLGAKTAKDVARGMGFKNMAQFKKFMNDGIIPDTFGQNLGQSGGSKGGPTKGRNKNNPTGATGHANTAHHTGGWVGSRGSRKGVARTLRGQHPTERTILARQGEFVVNQRAAEKNRGILEAINLGRTGPYPRNKPNGDLPGDPREGAGAGPGNAGWVSAAMARGLTIGIGKTMKNMVKEKKAQLDAAAAAYGAGAAGTFGGAAYGTEQLKNAAIIASVGSRMGMSKRDIQIAIMTAIQESTLMNLDHGMGSSVGLFQQIDSWGSFAQRHDPKWASRAFFNALKGVTDRNQMTPWAAAQAVQKSGFPGAYQDNWDDAVEILNKGLTRNKNGGYSSTGGPANAIGRRAIAWATGQIGAAGWYRMCQKFVRTALGAGPGASTAGGAWAAAAGKHRGDFRPPAGVPVYWTDGGAGHAALSTGGGNVISTDYPRSGIVGRGTVAGITRDWGKKYEGWTETINGKRVYNLNKGGYTTSDGMAMLHKNELVLDATRTKKTKNSIDKFNKVNADKKAKSLYNAVTSFGDIMNKVTRTTKLGLGGGYGGMVPGFSGLMDNSSQSGGVTASGGGVNVSTGGNNAGSGIGNLPGQGKGRASVKTAAYNMYIGTTAAQSKADMQKLMGRANVISLSEAKQKGGYLKPWLGKRNWGFYSGGHETALAWNRGMYDALRLNTRGINPKNSGKAGLQKRYAAYGLFQDRKSGRQFWQVSAHTVPARSPGHTTGTVAQRNAIQREQSNNLEKLFKDLKATGRPVIFGGDINRFIARGIEGKIHGAGNNTYQIFANIKAASSGRAKAGYHSDGPAIFGTYNLPHLKTGGTVKFDNTIANLHKDERVLTAGLSKDFEQGVKNFAEGGNAQYNVNVNVTGADVDENVIVRKTMQALKQAEARKPVARR